MKRLLALSVAFLAVIGSPAFASSGSWLGTHDDTWAGANWSASPPPGSADTATFNGAGNSFTTIDLGSGVSVKDITFDTSAVAYTIGASGVNAGGALTLSTGTITIASTFAGTGVTETIDAPVILGGSSTISNANTTSSNVLDIAGNISNGTSSAVTLTLGTGSTAGNAGLNTISGAISNGTSGGTTTVTMNGASSEWVLSGNNTYSGLTSVSRGTLVLSGNDSSASGGVTVGSGTTLDVNNANALGSGTFTIVNNSIFDNTSNAAITNLGNNAISAASSVSFTGTNSLNLGTGAVTIGNGSHGTWTVGANTLTVGGDITGTNYIVKAGAGTLVLSGDNSGMTGAAGFNLGAGGATISGMLAINSATALGTGAFGINAGSGGIATIDNTSGGAITDSENNTQTWTSGFTFAGSNALNMGTGNITMSNSLTVTTNASTLTEGGSIQSTTNSLTKAGAGTLVLSGANLYTGATTISGGTLQFAKTASLYNSTTSSWTKTNIKVASGGTIAFNVGGTGEFSTGASSNVTTLLTNLDRAVSSNGLEAGSAIGFDTTNATSVQTIVDNIQNTTGTGSGSVGLTKLGTGTLALSGTNTYSGGTTVSGGNLQLLSAAVGSTSSATGTGAVAVSGGGTTTVSGTGATLGLVTVTNGSHLAPGVNTSGTNSNFGSVGTLGLGMASTGGGLTLANAKLDFDLGTTNTAGLSDRITTTALNLGTLTFNLSGTTLQTGTFYDLINDTSETGFNVNNISTNFLGLLAGAYTAQYSIGGGTNGTDLEVEFTAEAQAAPEPGTWAMMLGGLALLGFIQRRRRLSLVRGSI